VGLVCHVSTYNVLMTRFLDAFSEFFGNSFDKSMEEKWEKGFSASIRNIFSGVED
jgi:hypothetical protein